VSGGFEGGPHSHTYHRTLTITSSGSRPPSPISVVVDTLAATRWAGEISLNIAILNWLAGCAIYNLSVSLLGCCLTLWSFLVQIGRVFSINRPDEAFGMSGQPGQNGGDAWQIPPGGIRLPQRLRSTFPRSRFVVQVKSRNSVSRQMKGGGYTASESRSHPIGKTLDD